MRVFSAVILFFLVSCRGQVKPEYKGSSELFTFQLNDSLGKISIAYPEGTDTFFRWIQLSDCGRPCEHCDYRFQSKYNRIFKESGFFWTGEPTDSVNQLSIYHQHPYKTTRQNDSLLLKDTGFIKDGILNDGKYGNVLSDTLIKIDGRYFYIFNIANFNSRTYVRERLMIAFTNISGILIEFRYKLLTKKYDSFLTRFFDQSLHNLKTIHIRDGG